MVLYGSTYPLFDSSSVLSHHAFVSSIDFEHVDDELLVKLAFHSSRCCIYFLKGHCCFCKLKFELINYY